MFRYVPGLVSLPLLGAVALSLGCDEQQGTEPGAEQVRLELVACGSSANEIKGCVAKTGGALRVIGARASCSGTETTLCWSQTGPQGANSVSAVTPIGVGDAACTAGGSLLSVGPDTDGDRVLDAVEVTATASVCNGAPGDDGLACWDLNGNEACDPEAEDLDGNGACDAADCAGAAGTRGSDGAPGDDGLACWDLNGNAACDLAAEDADGSGACGPADCAGPQGAVGAPGESVSVGDAPASECPSGGISVSAGGVTRFVCNADVSSLQTQIDELTARVAQLEKGSIYRWATWHTFNYAGAWYANNDASLFGGVTPSAWSDGNATAASLSSSSSTLRSLFTRQGPRIGTVSNALVYANEWVGPSSTDGQFVAALMRIKNTTPYALAWTLSFYATSLYSWGENASVALNGANVWTGPNASVTTPTSLTVSLPASRTSTVIVVSASGAPYSYAGYVRPTFLAFTNNSLTLPTGLEFVDDLDTKPDGWTN